MAARSDSNYCIYLFYEQIHAWCSAEVTRTGDLVVASIEGLEGGLGGEGC